MPKNQVAPITQDAAIQEMNRLLFEAPIAELAESQGERALCSNACLLSRALETQEGEPVFSSGREVLSGLRVEVTSTQ